MKSQSGQGIIEFVLIVIVMLAIAYGGYTIISPVVANQSPAAARATISLADAVAAYQKAVYGPHFNDAKHSGEDPDPQKIDQMIRTGACQPITVYECVSATVRLKFTCPVTPDVTAGLVVGMDDPVTIVTAFDGENAYWTLGKLDSNGMNGLNNCTVVGTVLHP